MFGQYLKHDVLRKHIFGQYSDTINIKLILSLLEENMLLKHAQSCITSIKFILILIINITLLDKCLIQNFEIIRTCIPLDISISWVYVWLPHE